DRDREEANHAKDAGLDDRRRDLPEAVHEPRCRSDERRADEQGPDQPKQRSERGQRPVADAGPWRRVGALGYAVDRCAAADIGIRGALVTKVTADGRASLNVEPVDLDLHVAADRSLLIEQEGAAVERAADVPA